MFRRLTFFGTQCIGWVNETVNFNYATLMHLFQTNSLHQYDQSKMLLILKIKHNSFITIT